MPLIITPGQLKEQAEFYHQLASLVASGIPLLRAAETLKRNPPNRALGRVADALIDGITRGATFTEAMVMTGRHLPDFDIALIEAGEGSGRLDQCFRLLANYYEEKGRLASMVMAQLAYPAFMVHLAILIFPTGLLADLVWKGEIGPFVAQKLAVILPLYLGCFAFMVAFQSRRSRRWRAALERFLHMIPLVGKARQDLALARLSAALEALLNAGVLVIQAWEIAARASGSPRIQRAEAEARPRIAAGETPAEVISQQPVYPEVFSGSYRTGEVSGRLDETLRRLHTYYQESATRRLRALADWLPKLVYVAVLIGIGFQIVSFWANYFGDAQKALQSISN